MTGLNGVNSYLYGNTSNTMPSSSQFSVFPPRVSGSADISKGSLTGYKPAGKNDQPALSSDSAKSYLTAVKDFGAKLKTATANASQAGQSSVFAKSTGVSSNNEALSVSVANQAGASKLNNAKSVSVQALATSQQNTGTAFNAASLNGADTGKNQFTIEQNGKSYSFAVNINAYDSVRTAQQKTADAINSQSIGVTASVQYDEKSRTSSLILTSDKTGAENAFNVSDTPGKGSLIESLGAGQSSREARDAQYTVNGEEKTSATNTVDLGDGITGTLKKAGAEEINVTVRKDTDAILNAVRGMVDNFNGLLKTAKDNGSDRGASALRQRLDSISSSYEQSLANIGVTRSNDGYLEIDGNKLKKAFENGQAERNLGNDSAGFTQRLSRVAEQADKNPGQFLSYQSRNNIDASATGFSDSSKSDSVENEYYKFMSSYKNIQLSNIGLLLSMGV